MSLEGKTVVITGAASGIGAASAARIKAHGAHVIGVDLNEPAADVDRYVAADLSDESSIAEAARAIEGPVDALCNIAGLPPSHPVEKVLQVNVLGLRAFTLALLPKISSGGAIVNMASVAGMGWPEEVPKIKALLALESLDATATFAAAHKIGPDTVYQLTKAAVIVWTMQNWSTWSDRGIRVNSVSPGPVDTPILPDFMATLGRADEDRSLVPRPGQPDEIAHAVAFLADPANTWVNGHDLRIDGGLSAALTGGKLQL